MITVFYDGACGLCSREINYYRRIAPPAVFDWQDITKTTTELEREGISLTEALRLLHARDSNGTLHIGVDAFILIWQELKHWRLLAALVSLAPIHWLARHLYTTFAAWRFKRLPHCQVDTGKSKTEAQGASADRKTGLS
ncbi:thiol-disulfide oxidoreductase DCC family protein [Kiloniella sp. b19]|uniref:thiol-disulfide oxidoreductase DCC family protein n=1 Tax=Kiloniella sp. GXU_MW_B19 TaxID=3141326 RepID=UPI0031E4249F